MEPVTPTLDFVQDWLAEDSAYSWARLGYAAENLPLGLMVLMGGVLLQNESTWCWKKAAAKGHPLGATRMIATGHDMSDLTVVARNAICTELWHEVRDRFERRGLVWAKAWLAYWLNYNGITEKAQPPGIFTGRWFPHPLVQDLVPEFISAPQKIMMLVAKRIGLDRNIALLICSYVSTRGCWGPIYELIEDEATSRDLIFTFSCTTDYERAYLKRRLGVVRVREF